MKILKFLGIQPIYELYNSHFGVKFTGHSGFTAVLYGSK